MAHQQFIHQVEFANGLTLVAQQMPWLQSAAFTLGMPAGCRFDPIERLGLSSFTCEMAFRGGGGYSSRALIEALESIGCDYYSNTGVYQTFFGGALPADNLEAALDIYFQTIRNADLPEGQLEDGRNTCLQDVYALDDDLAGTTMLDLRLRHYGHPFGRNSDGTIAGLEAVTLSDIRGFFERYYQMSGSIIAVAGNFDWDRLKARVEQLSSTWPSNPVQMPDRSDEQHGYYHIPFESKQTHIGLACSWIPYRDENYYVARAAIGVLSDGMSSRLFREVRERRGLCYTVSANCHSLHDRGAVFAYSGTTTQSAQETLDVILQEFDRLSRDGIDETELAKVKVGFRSNLIMQQESCRSRVGTIANDIFHLGRVRMLDEINERINALTVQNVNEFLGTHPLGPFDLVTLGESELEVPDGIAAA